MSLARALAAGCALGLLVWTSCAQQTLRTTKYTTAETRDLDIRKVAIAPFRPANNFRTTSERDPDGPAAAQLVERFISEALTARGVQVVPAGDVRTALKLTDPEAAPPPDPIVAKVVHQEFGTPALLTGKIYRMRERSGEAFAGSTPASVWFDITLVSAPGGRRMWNAVFNETQKPLNENLFNARRYPGGGTRWLRAEELARWGARELAREFPTGLEPAYTGGRPRRSR